MKREDIKKVLIMACVFAILVFFSYSYVFKDRSLVQIFRDLFGRQSQLSPESQVKLGEIDRLILDGNCFQVLVLAKAHLEQNPTDAEIWLKRGVCEFDLAKFTEAKASFQRVLSLDSQNQVAKNYLRNLENSGGGIMLTGQPMPFDRATYESLSGLKFSSAVLRFERVTEQRSNIIKYLTATYTRVGNVSNTVDYLKEELAKVTENISVSEVDGNTIVVGGSQSEMIAVTLNGNSSSVTVNYQKLMP